MTENDIRKRWKEDPLMMQAALWPEVEFYDKQKEIIYSVRDNVETYAVAGNMLGKDFVSGFIALHFLICHDVARVITTSVKDDHLRVLWGEIENFIRTSSIPLDVRDGGFLQVNHHDITKTRGTTTGIAKSYLRGMVSHKGEGMAGHHAEHTLLLIDEASGVDDVTYTQGMTWAKRLLVIGNPNTCNNFFFKGVKAGDLEL